MMQRCNKCNKKKNVLIRVKVYSGKDEDFGHLYNETLWCFHCVNKNA